MSRMLEQIHRAHAGEPPMMLIDLGCVNDQAARDRADRIRATGLGKKNISLEGYDRIFVRIPPKKVVAILAAFPAIKEGATYYQSTHNWLEG